MLELIQHSETTLVPSLSKRVLYYISIIWKRSTVYVHDG